MYVYVCVCLLVGAGVRELRSALRVSVVQRSERSSPICRGPRIRRPGQDQALQPTGHPHEERTEGGESLGQGDAHRSRDQARLFGNRRRRLVEGKLSRRIFIV